MGTEVGNIHREKEEGDKEKGLKEDYKDWKKN